MDNLIVAVRAVLAATPARWQTLADTLPATLLDRPPLPGRWSALDCLRHLNDTERWVFPVRVRDFLEGRDFEAFDPDAEGSHGTPGSATDLIADFAGMRAASLALLDTVGHDDLPRTAHHAELGRVTLEEMLHEWAAHDLNHTIQAEQALMQPFIAGCGPWRHYFEAHDLGHVEGNRGSLS